MGNLTRVLCVVAALMGATPALSQTQQATTAFDGTYRGVSRTAEGGMGGDIVHAPAPLTEYPQR